jgi:tetratricopeptide (TPR) repeat protein/energy-coupling factor transporter ATP-binding protein EcfA2
VTPNPFPGLRPFQPEEDHLFFGRESEISELLRRLRTTRFLAVVGASGSGKSSLVRSGLIPSLQSGFMVGTGSGWRIAMLRPGENPVGHLATALDASDVLGVEGELAETNRVLLEATLRRSTLGLANAVLQARLPPGENVLVVVDQFEELFRFRRSRQIAGSRDEAVAFVRLLLDAAAKPDAPVFVALTMRSDFIGDCVEFPGLSDAVNQGMYLVGRMSRDALRSAITGPVAVAGGAISPRLVHRILNDLGDDQDQLPLVQHALMRTWDHWVERRTGALPEAVMDVEDYEAIGTIQGALSLHAEEAFAEVIPLGLGPLTERVFRALTDTFSDPRGVRRPTSLAELASICDAPEEDVARVVEVFRRPGRAFLMPPIEAPVASSSIVDLSHESLMRCWARLIRWADEERDAASFYARLSQAARWHEEGLAGLWRTPEIELAQRWREQTRPTAAWAERYDDGFERAIDFLDTSQRELDAHRARETRERKAKLRRTQGAVAVLAAFLVVAAGLAYVAWQERVRATSNLALARAAVDEALAHAELDPEGVAAHVPELEEFRRELLERAQLFYAEFLQQESRSEAARADIARAHLRLGHINRMVGRPDEAVREYSRAVESYGSLAAQYPGTAEYRQALAEAHNWLGETLRPLAGRGSEAAAEYDRALELQRALVREDPDTERFRIDLARTLYNRGILKVNQDFDLEGGAADFREAVALLEAVETGDPAAEQSLARAFNNLAGTLYMSMEEEQMVEAALLYERAVAIHEGLVSAHPNNREYRLELSKFSNNVAGLLVQLGRPEEADRHSRRAVEILQELARLLPVLALERADAHTLRGGILQTHDPQGSLASFREAVDQFGAMHEDPALHRLPDFHLRFGELLSALAAFAREHPQLLDAQDLLSRAVGFYVSVALEVASSGSEAAMAHVMESIDRVLPALPPSERERFAIVQSQLGPQIHRQF